MAPDQRRQVEAAAAGEVEILRAAAIGENVLKVGEDVAQGEEVIPVGTRLRPAEIGGLMALGITRLMVARQPRVGILSSGDEVVPPEVMPGAGQVRDVNAYTLSALVQAAGGLAVRYGIIPDNQADMRAAAGQALHECDLVVITGDHGVDPTTPGTDHSREYVPLLAFGPNIKHGVDLGPLRPNLLGRLATRDRRVQLAPPLHVADLERAASALQPGASACVRHISIRKSGKPPSASSTASSYIRFASSGCWSSMLRSSLGSALMSKRNAPVPSTLLLK